MGEVASASPTTDSCVRPMEARRVGLNTFMDPTMARHWLLRRVRTRGCNAEAGVVMLVETLGRFDLLTVSLRIFEPNGVTRCNGRAFRFLRRRDLDCERDLGRVRNGRLDS